MSKSVSTPKTEYVKVTIYDAGNNRRKNYEFPTGTIFETTNEQYHIDKTGISVFRKFTDSDGTTQYGYQGDLIKNEINVILPQYQALDVLDVNNDNKIDQNDIDNAHTFTQTDDGGVDVEESLADFEINHRLEDSGSNYRVMSDWGSGVIIDREESAIHVNFGDIREDNRYSYPNGKSLSIDLPN